jgi:hypothetical protein
MSEPDPIEVWFVEDLTEGVELPLFSTTTKSPKRLADLGERRPQREETAAPDLAGDVQLVKQ